MATDPATPPPTTSRTQDTYTHHTSPTGAAVPQQALVKVPVKTPKVAREVTGTIRRHTLPDTVYKHSNPVGRPKLSRG